MSLILPRNYQEAQSAFLKAASKNHDLSAYTLPGFKGPSEEDLTCDVAASHVDGAEIAIVTTSAIHGVEGYAGSVLQQRFLELSKEHHKKISFIHVHALNPHGFAYDRRADAENFDVNRNFLEIYPPVPLEDEYHDYADLIVPKPHTEGLWSELQLIYYSLTQQSRMKDIITRGQSSCPNGMYYTGLKPSWSRVVWEDIIATHLSRYPKVIHIDLHTGLGGGGDLQIMAASAHSPDADFARGIWGERLAFMSDNSGNNTTLSSPTIGEILSFWDHANIQKPTSAATYLMEFGTLPPLAVFKALRADHAAYARGERDPAALAPINAQMRNAFAPSDPAWIAKVLDLGGTAYQKLLQAL